MTGLLFESVRLEPLRMFLGMTVAKLTYGTLGTCVALMKLEAFPTEIRVSAFAIISVAAKLLCALAPTLIEMLKVSEVAESWSSERLTMYIALLLAAVLTTGLMSLFVRTPDAAPLRDFCQDPAAIKGGHE